VERGVFVRSNRRMIERDWMCTRCHQRGSRVMSVVIERLLKNASLFDLVRDKSAGQSSGQYRTVGQ